ncbi:DUF512 domain-containing protein [bacterium]
METQTGFGGDDGREGIEEEMKSNIASIKHSRLLRIHHIDLNSLASKAGLKKGDEIASINGRAIEDIIDLQFYGADSDLNIIAYRNGHEIKVNISNPDMLSLGIEPDEMKYRCCGNHCQFCFVDQNPKGLRSTLYLKDEDYRLSFMHGNYVTLTNITERDLNRIVVQRLAPLYLSIHAVNPAIRKQLLGIKKDDRLLEKLQFLADNDIEMHGQIVICPGFNDGSELENTIQSLSAFYPHLKTLAIVPVGLTKHRKNLPGLQSVTSEKAAAIIEQVRPYQNKFQKEFNHHFIYLADEFYLLAKAPLPDETHYGEFWQVENGVGMTRLFLDDFSQETQFFPKRLKKPCRTVIVTGMLAAPILQKTVLPVLEQIDGLDVSLLPVKNQFYGPSVTVSGLLTGQDIFAALQQIDGEFNVLLPENCINHEGYFLDDMTPETLSDSLNQSVNIIAGFGELWN